MTIPLERLERRRNAIARANKKVRDQYLNRDISLSKGTQTYMKAQQKEIRKLINTAEGWDQSHLPVLLSDVEARTESLNRGFQSYVTNEQSRAWDNGKDSVEKVLVAGDVRVQLPILGEAQLVALQGHSLSLVNGLQGEMTKRVQREISLSVLGGINQFETAVRIDQVLGTKRHGGFTYRAERIARTETNRAYSTANRLRREQTKELIPGITKRWLTGSNPRETHAAADGQTVPVNDPFLVGGHYCDGPHDPTLPAEEIVNCNCVDLTILPDSLLKQDNPSAGVSGQKSTPPPKKKAAPKKVAPKKPTRKKVYDDPAKWNKKMDDYTVGFRSETVEQRLVTTLKTDSFRKLMGKPLNDSTTYIQALRIRSNLGGNFHSSLQKIGVNEWNTMARTPKGMTRIVWHETMHGAQCTSRYFHKAGTKTVRKAKFRSGNYQDFATSKTVKESFEKMIDKSIANAERSLAKAGPVSKKKIESQIKSLEKSKSYSHRNYEGALPDREWEELGKLGVDVFDNYGCVCPGEYVSRAAKKMVYQPEFMKAEWTETYDLMINYWKRETGLSEGDILKLLKAEKTRTHAAGGLY